MGIEELFANKPKVVPIVIKKFRIEGDTATVIREIRKAIGGNITQQEVIVALIEEGARAYRKFCEQAGDEQPAPALPDA